jgi:hypothetical protein
VSELQKKRVSWCDTLYRLVLVLFLSSFILVEETSMHGLLFALLVFFLLNQSAWPKHGRIRAMDSMFDMRSACCI